MGNIAYFEIPTDDIERARKFYSKVFGWEIKNTPMPNLPDYSSVNTGKAIIQDDASLITTSAQQWINDSKSQLTPPG